MVRGKRNKRVEGLSEEGANTPSQTPLVQPEADDSRIPLKEPTLAHWKKKMPNTKIMTLKLEQQRMQLTKPHS